MTMHRNKRVFQQENKITKYFVAEEIDGSASETENEQDQRGVFRKARFREGDRAIDRSTRSHNNYNHDTYSYQPDLPGAVQADLLSVGMRVRKSVPEGYKTTNSKLAGLPSIQTTMSKPTTSTNFTSTTTMTELPPDALPLDAAHQRELLPFCGLHKIGGYAEQPTTNIHLYAGLDSTGMRAQNPFPLPVQAFTAPFSSQGSADSGYSSNSRSGSYRDSGSDRGGGKRGWQDDDGLSSFSMSAGGGVGEGFFFAIPMKGPDIDEVPVSPLSVAPQPPAPRAFAHPKSQRARRTGMRGAVGAVDEGLDVDMDADQEHDAVAMPVQRTGRVMGGSASDFEEADFLASEVDMGGL